MVWDSNTGRLMYFLPQPAINFLAFSADTGSIATWTGSGTGTTPGSHDVWLWDALDGELNHRLAGHTGYVWNVRWHPDGSSLLSASDDGTIIQWNPETGEVIEEFHGPQIFPGSLFWSSNTRYFVSAGYSNKERRARLIVWDPATAAPRYTVDSPTQEWQLAASGASNGRWLVAFSPERLSLIEAETGTIAASLVGAPLDIEVWLLAWSADSSTLTTTYALMDSQTTSLWDVADRRPIDTRQQAGVFQPFPEIHVSPNGQYDLQVTSEQVGEWWQQRYRSTISVIRLSDNVRVARMAGPHASVTRVAWSPDNTHFAVAGGLDAEFLGDTVVKGWDENAVLICNRETISCRVLPGHTGQVQTLNFSPDGQLLATAATDGTVVIWQVSP
jgi:WD40 repeat protein